MSLIGFDKIKAKLIDSYQQNRLHHAILLNGKSGIGKASFAKEFAFEILGAKNENHPDLFLIEKEEGKKEISVEKIREISKFLNQTSAISKNKFIIIDSADELNRSSSNALLKILEEPHNNNFLILISHSISKLLPTIRSRCQIVKINDLNFEDFTKVLHDTHPKFLPKIPDDKIKILSEICDNSPAKAISEGDDVIWLYSSLLNSLKNKIIDGELLKKIGEKNFNFENFSKIINFFFLRLAKYYSGQIDYFLFEEKEIFQHLKNKFSIEEIFAIDSEVKSQIAKTASLNLDKKLTLINIFNQIRCR